MSDRPEDRPLPSGKVSLELLARLLAKLPPWPPEVRLGARVGEDACAIDVPAGVLVAAADPITLTSEDAGRLSVIVNANDVAVTGARPCWFLAVVLVPPGTSEALVDGIFASLRGALAELGAHLVGGHTEVTPAVTRPIVVGQMLGLAESDTVVTTGGFGPGDVVVQVRPAPIEGAAVFAQEAPDRLAGVAPWALDAARAAVDEPGISVVEPALLAARLGVLALHDPTEGGLLGGLHELARAAGVRIVVEPDSVLWFEPGAAVCRAIGADPWATLASGTLLAVFAADRVGFAVARFGEAGYDAAAIGVARAGTGVETSDGTELARPERDEVARLLGG